MLGDLKAARQWSIKPVNNHRRAEPNKREARIASPYRIYRQHHRN
jgi:hypothetical protein